MPQISKNARLCVCGGIWVAIELPHQDRVRAVGAFRPAHGGLSGDAGYFHNDGCDAECAATCTYWTGIAKSLRFAVFRGVQYAAGNLACYCFERLDVELKRDPEFSGDTDGATGLVN